MRKFRVKYDWVLFGLLMVFLFLALFQKWTGLFPIRPLGGVIEPTPKPELTLENYRNMQYQRQLEAYISENFGLREPVIRTYNQYLWTTYHKTYCSYIEPGKKGWLYYKSAVSDYYGKELLGHFKTTEDAITRAETELANMNKLRQVLKGYGIEFLAFIAPDKALVYPEYLPRHDADTTTPNMADYFDRRMTETGFPHINMTSWFIAMRDTVPFPLFPKADSHWEYTAIYGYDSLFRFMNTLGGPQFPTLHIGPPETYISDKVIGDESVLNLLFRVRGNNVKYKSEITVEADASQRKPRVLFVGDSFIWSIVNLPVRELLDEMEIWYYNNSAVIGFDKTKVDLKDINRLRHILKADYVVFYASGHQWWNATFDFARKTLKLFSEATEAEIEKSMKINEIERNKNWSTALKIYASRQGLPLEQVLEQEADNVLENKTLFREDIMTDTATLIQIKKEEIRRQWQSDLNQMRMLEEKAQERKISLEEMIEIDINWVIEKQIEKGELY